MYDDKKPKPVKQKGKKFPVAALSAAMKSYGKAKEKK